MPTRKRRSNRTRSSHAGMSNSSPISWAALRSIREGDRTLLDNSMIMCGSSISDGNRHDPNNLPILLGGKGGGGIKSGQHIASRATPRSATFTFPCCTAWESTSLASATALRRYRGCWRKSFGPLITLSHAVGDWERTLMATAVANDCKRRCTSTAPGATRRAARRWPSSIRPTSRWWPRWPTGGGGCRAGDRGGRAGVSRRGGRCRSTIAPRS